MDPLTVLMTALGVGATLLKPAADKAVADGYDALKTLIVRKFGKRDPALDSVLSHHAQDPEGWRHPTEQLLAGVGADRDQEVLDRATELIRRAETTRPGISAGLIGQINAQGGRVVVTHADRGGYAAGRDIIIGGRVGQELLRIPGLVKALLVFGTVLAIIGFAIIGAGVLSWIAALPKLGPSSPPPQFPPPGVMTGAPIFFSGIVLLVLAGLAYVLTRRPGD